MPKVTAFIVNREETSSTVSQAVHP
jgi:hypothetical protein